MTVHKIHGLQPQTNLQRRGKIGQPDFSQELARASANQLKFSAHAQTRLQERRIQISPLQLRQLEGAVERARAKGAKDSLILVDQLAFVVSVENRTVITLAGKDDLKEQIFTNIDSAVIVDGADRKGPRSH